MEADQNIRQSEEVTENSEIISQENKSGARKKTWLKIFVVFVVLALIGGGAWFLLSSPQQNTDDIFPEDSLNSPSNDMNQSEPSPTSTPTPIEVNKSTLRIELLNGSGIPGEASLVKSELEELGYENIETGNADDQNYEETVVTFSSDLPQEFIEDFIAELENIYVSVNSKVSSNLDNFDIEIIAGLRSSYTPAPTKASVTPTPQASITSTPTPTNTQTPTASSTPTP